MEEVVVLSPDNPIYLQVMKDLKGEPFEGVDSEPVPFKDEIVNEKDLWRYKSMSYSYSSNTSNTFGVYTNYSKVTDKSKDTTHVNVEMDDLYEKMRRNIDKNGSLIFTPPSTSRPCHKGSIQDLLWLADFCNSVAPISAKLSVSLEGRFITITYPRLHKKQIKFLVNRIILRKKINMVDTALFFSRESLRQANKTIIYCIKNGKITETIDKKSIIINISDLLEFISELWIHMQENIDDLWLTGTGEPHPDEDHSTYLNEMAKK